MSTSSSKPLVGKLWYYENILHSDQDLRDFLTFVD